MNRKFFCAMSAALLFLSSPAHSAQSGQPVADEERDCILVGVHWDAAGAETAAILDEPIPASYLARLNNRAPCAPGAPSDGLVQWHLQFGSEQSTLAALQFVVSHQYQSSANDDIWFARLAVMAADFWRSQRILDFSERYLDSTRRWLALAQTAVDDAEPFADSTMGRDDVLRRAPDIVLRAAVVKAEVSGDRRDYESAMALVQQLTPADFVTAAGLAYGSGDDFCDWGTGRLNAERLALFSERCEEFETAGSNLWDIHTRMHLSPFTSTASPATPFSFATEQAASFLTRQQRNDNIAPGSRRYHDEIYRLVALYVGQADARFRQHRTSRDVGNAANQAQYHLLKAIPWISAADHPNLFRRVASRYLELDAIARRERPADIRSNHQEDRFVAWMQEEVALLDRLYGRRQFNSAYQP